MTTSDGKPIRKMVEKSQANIGHEVPYGNSVQGPVVRQVQPGLKKASRAQGQN